MWHIPSGRRTTGTNPPADYPPRFTRGWFAAWWLAAVVSFGFLRFWYRYLDVLASRMSRAPLKPFIEEMTGSLVWGLLFFAVACLCRRYPLERDAWPRRTGVYTLALLVFAAAATTGMWVLRLVLYPLAGLGPYDYGVMAWRYPMEFPMQVILFACTVAGIHVVRSLRAAHERELRNAHLETSLAQAQLRSLRLQLQPHFLFNALNTISSTMYRDPRTADEIIEQLAALLRASLKTAQTDEVPLREELGILDQYLGIMRARFGDALAVSLDVDGAPQQALVPSMLLQPLVENAIRHGNATRVGRASIQVRARRDGQRLVLEVEDDGPGVEADGQPSGSGVGLSATSERLRLLYGDAQRFEAANLPRGGFLSKVTIPLRVSAACPERAREPASRREVG